MSRPEYVAPPDIFYSEDEAKKYAVSSRMIHVQSAMADRAIELLNLPSYSENGELKLRPAYILDVGCGSGLSGEALTRAGLSWVGIDISPSMLGVALKREVDGDLICADMGQRLFFRPGAFDGAISISALQWLCNADQSEHIPEQRLKRFFQSLYTTLKAGARAVFQFYPASSKQVTLINLAAMRSGFSGGLVVDFPNSAKARKYYLCLFAGEPSSRKNEKNKTEAGSTFMTLSEAASTSTTPLLPAMSQTESDKSDSQSTISFTDAKDIKFAKGERRATKELLKKKSRKRAPVKSRQWVLQKKDRMRTQGKKTAGDSHYSGRKRGPKF